MGKKFIVLLIVACIVISLITGGVVYTLNKPKGEILIAIIKVDKTIARVSEVINFTGVNSKGETILYSWDFGDGNKSIGCDVSKSYTTSAWYYVNLTIKSRSGKEANTTKLIGVQHKDEYKEIEFGRHRDIRPLWKSGWGTTIFIAPNIGLPKTEVKCEVYNVVGEVGVEVWVYNSTNRKTAYKEYKYGKGEDITFVCVVPPEELLENSSRIDGIAFVDQGRYGGGNLLIKAIFPVENVTKS